jgi:3-oxoacyl-(acyl-carrier-protein) synthase
MATTIAAEVKGFDPASVLEGKRLRRSARFTQFAVKAAREAVADAGLVVDDTNRGQIGVVVNAAVAGFDTIEDATSAKIEPEQIDYISAHGTGTRANDRTDTAAIRSAFGAAADRVAVSSPKSMVGHLIGAAGALGAMVAVLAIRDGVVPPTTNLTTPDPECDLDYVPNVARRLGVRAATANAFGFGGQNCVAVFVADE